MRKPAGWSWSAPDEVFENGVLWTATRFGSKLLGLRLKSTGTVRKPRVSCVVFAEEKMSSALEADVTRMLRRALRVEEGISEFYALARNDSVLHGVVKDLYGMRIVAWPGYFLL